MYCNNNNKVKRKYVVPIAEFSVIEPDMLLDGSVYIVEDDDDEDHTEAASIVFDLDDED